MANARGLRLRFGVKLFADSREHDRDFASRLSSVCLTARPLDVCAAPARAIEIRW